MQSPSSAKNVNKHKKGWSCNNSVVSLHRFWRLEIKNRTLIYEKIIFQDLGVTAELSTFTTENGITEQHAVLHVEPREELFAGQFQRMQQAEDALLATPSCTGSQVVLKRYFLSDATNQASSLNPQPFPTLPFRGLGGGGSLT